MKTGGVLACTFGPRTDETCCEWLALLPPLTRVCWPLMTGAVMPESFRKKSIWLVRYLRNKLSVTIWRFLPVSSYWREKQFISHVPSRSTKKSLSYLSKNTCSTNWRYDQIPHFSESLMLFDLFYLLYICRFLFSVSGVFVIIHSPFRQLQPAFC